MKCNYKTPYIKTKMGFDTAENIKYLSYKLAHSKNIIEQTRIAKQLAMLKDALVVHRLHTLPRSS